MLVLLVRAGRRSPLTLLVADEVLWGGLLDWPEIYRELMGRCRNPLRDVEKAVAA